MKDFPRILLALALNVLAFALVGGCSKQDAEAKKVNVTAMMDALKSADKDTRVNACAELAKAGPRSAPAVPSLISLLKDPDPEVRKLAVYALGEIGPNAKSALPTLKEMMNDPDRGVVMAVANTLRSIDPKGFSDLKNTTVSGQP